MSDAPKFLSEPHDKRDPNPWLALYLDQSLPLAEEAKRAWVSDLSSRSRQFLLPLVRPLARGSILLIQVFKLLLPRALNAPGLLHRVLAWSMRIFLTPSANFLILRHFHLGSEILRFVADNVRGVNVETLPLQPTRIEDVRNSLFLQHDLNLFNFVIELNRQLRDQGLAMAPRERLDFSAISERLPVFEPLPQRFSNFVDLETAIELYTPVYQLLLTDNDFWRASNSLQLDETLALYVSQLLGVTWQLALVNNKHPLVPMTIVRAGYRLVLHGLATECLHALLVRAKQAAAEVEPGAQLRRPAAAAR
jgi:hypothetical protein